MKKQVFILGILFIVSLTVQAGKLDSIYGDGKSVIDTLYHDATGAVETLYSDTKSGFKDLYPDIKGAIISISKAIGVAAEHVYGVLVKKYFVEGVKELCITLIGIIALLFGWIKWNKVTPQGEPITYKVIPPLIFLVTGIFILTINVDYDALLMGLLNPEYGAINYILEFIRK